MHLLACALPLALVNVLPASLVPRASPAPLDSSVPSVKPVRRTARPAMMVLPVQEFVCSPQLPTILPIAIVSMESVDPTDSVHAMQDLRRPVTEPHVLHVRLVSSCPQLVIAKFARLVALNVRMVQGIAPPVNQVFPKMRTMRPNAILLSQPPPQVILVPLVASATVPLARRVPRRARRVREERPTTASSVLLVSFLLMAAVYRPTQMVSVRDRVLSLITINGNVIPVALNARPARYPTSM